MTPRLSLVLDEFRLVLAALQAAPGDQLDSGLDDERGAQPLADRLRELRAGRRAARELDADRQRRLLLDTGRARPQEDVAAGLREAAHDLADGRGEDVDAAHDQHVVGAADAADPRAGAPARARRGAHDDVVARAEAQQRGRAMAQVAEHELAGRAVCQLHRLAAAGVDHLEAGEAVRAEVHPVLVLALAEQRDADVPDAHRLGDPGAPAVLQHRPEARLAAARLARHEHALDARAAE